MKPFFNSPCPIYQKHYMTGGNMAGIFIPITFFVVTGVIIYYFFKARHEERMQVIEKGLQGEQLDYFLKTRQRDSNLLANIKYGLMLISIGLAIFLGTFAPSHQQEEITFGFIFLLPGISLIIYYAIAKKQVSQKPSEPLT